MFLLDQAGTIYAGVHSGQIDIVRLFARVQAILPGWTTGLLQRSGIMDLGSFREQLSIGVEDRLQELASRALTIGQGAASFLLALAVMLYLTFFLLRDGQGLAGHIGLAVPLPAPDRALLADRFVTVVRATVKAVWSFLVLITTLGGLSAFRFNGLLIGPVAAALFITVWKARTQSAPCNA